MIRTESQNLLAPGIGARIMIINNNADLPPYFIIENKDDGLSISYEFQESDTGSSWSTVTGTAVNVPPLTSSAVSVDSNKRKLALFAQGNARIDVHTVRNYNGDNTSLD